MNTFFRQKLTNKTIDLLEKVEDKKAVNSLPIYTEEELKQFADEEEEDDISLDDLSFDDL